MVWTVASALAAFFSFMSVYLQPIDMEPEGHMRKAADSDAHLEADIHALSSNVNGYSEGAWIPFLLVRYEITKIGSHETTRGEMMPMVASDGPHYGDRRYGHVPQGPV